MIYTIRDMRSDQMETSGHIPYTITMKSDESSNIDVDINSNIHRYHRGMISDPLPSHFTHVNQGTGLVTIQMLYPGIA